MWSLIQTVPNWSARAAAQRPADVARPDRGGEAVADVVCPGDRLGVVGEALHGDDRPEHLALDDLVALGDVGDDGRRDEVAALAGDVAAGEHVAPCARSRNPSTRSCWERRDHRPHLDLGAAGRVADRERLDRRHELLEQRVVDLRPGEDARGGGAVLAGVPVAGDLDRLGDRGRIGVVEDDHRRLAAELEVDALQRVGGRAGDRLAGLDVAGERDEPHVGMA